MELKAPINVHWELTTNCNLSCKHCYQQHDQQKKTQLKKEELLYIAKNMIDAGVFQVTLTGGEPFLVDSLEELIKLFNENGIRPHITSNGTLLNQKIISWLKDTSCTLQISLDSHIPSTHNFIRQKNNAFELAECAFNLLKGVNIPTSLAFCANKKNYLHLEGLILFAIKVGIRIVMVGEIISIFGPTDQTNSLAFNTQEYEIYINSVTELRDKYKSQIEIIVNSEWAFLYSNKIDHSPCTALDRDMAILHDGKVSPCPFIRNKNYAIGDMLSDDLQTIWKSNEAYYFRNNKHQGCSNSCSYFKKCKSGCKAQLANQNLPISLKDPRCPLGEKNMGGFNEKLQNC